MFQTPYFSSYGGNPFFCPQPQPRYHTQQNIDPFFAPVFSGMGMQPTMQPTPTRAPMCGRSVANLRTSTPAKQLNRTQSTANMRAPAPTPARQPKAQPKPQAPAKKEPQFKAYETDAAYHILGSLPDGVDKKSIDIRFEDSNNLYISGTISNEKQKQELEAQSDAESEVESESESEFESESEVESESESESAIDTESSTEVESETKADIRSLQPYVEDTDDIDDPRTPRARASLQMRRGSSSSSRSSASSASSVSEAPIRSSTSANSAKLAQTNHSATLNAQAKPFKPQQTKTAKTAPTSKPGTKQTSQTQQVKQEAKKATTTEKFNKKFQFPRPVEMRGVKARLEGDKLEVMAPKKRVMMSPGMWWV